MGLDMRWLSLGLKLHDFIIDQRPDALFFMFSNAKITGSKKHSVATLFAVGVDFAC